MTVRGTVRAEPRAVRRRAIPTEDAKTQKPTVGWLLYFTEIKRESNGQASACRQIK